MPSDPLIAALRSDPAPQRRAQAAMIEVCREWHEDRQVAPVLAELKRFGSGAAIDACPELLRIFTEPDAAERFVCGFSAHFSRALRETPLGHLSLRHGFDGTCSTLLLSRAGRAHLVLAAREPGRQNPRAVTFSDALRYEAITAGEARAVIVRRCEEAGSDARLYEEKIALGTGARLALDCRAEALLVERVERRLVTLRLHRQAGDPLPSTEHDRATGRLVLQSCGDLSISRRETMVTLLGRMDRAEAAPVLAEMALEPGDASLRWQALRECLALDTAHGFVALCTLACDAADPLAGDAGALRAQLIETHPQLAALEEPRCPA